MAGWLYSLLAHLLRLAAWPTLWWLGRRTPAFRERWAERRARAPWPPQASGGIVVHAVSMGEVIAATPLVEALLAARTGLPLVLTCTTPTASALIRERFGDRVHHRYLPFDTPGAVRRFLVQSSPRLLVVMETELWPNLLRLAQARGTAVIVAGGRLSARSAARYARWRSLTGPLLSCIDLLLVQDDAARERFLTLGAPPARVQVTGNPKFDAPLPAGSEALRQRFGRLTAGRRVWVAASTHEGEEVAALHALARLRGRWPDLLLVLVPRHPQRFDAVAALLDERGLPWQRRSALGEIDVDGGCGAGTAVLLGDTMGELHAWYGVAEAAFIGGTLVARGGHSPLEAMAFGTPIVHGPHVFNFAEAFAALEAADAARQVADADGLAGVLDAWLTDPAAARAIGQRGQGWGDRQRGAGERCAGAVLGWLRRLPPLAERADGPWMLRADVDLVAPEAGRLLAGGWPTREAVAGSGRGSAWFVQDGGLAGVLRHYRRGGRVAAWLGDRYLHTAPAASRALAEFAVLRRLRAANVPVPRPLLAGVRRHGPFDRCAIVVERVPAARDLGQRLTAAPLPPATWRRLGEAVAALHAAGVDHRDLNCRNLLLDAGDAAWIVDLDGCRARPMGPWADANLARLRRSLRKEAARCAADGCAWHWDEAADWPVFVDAHGRALQAAREGRGGVGAAALG